MHLCAICMSTSKLELILTNYPPKMCVHKISLQVILKTKRGNKEVTDLTDKRQRGQLFNQAATASEVLTQNVPMQLCG